MKAAFLLVTAACFTGQVPAVPGGADKKPELVKPPASAMPAPVASTVVPGGCDSCADTGSGHGHFGRFGGGGFGLFKGRGCDGGCDSCGSTGHTRCHHARATSCDTCGGSSGGFFSRFKGRFGGHGQACGCDGGCGTTGCASGGVSGGCAPSVAPPEPVNPPKKMPTPVKEGPPPAKVGFEPQSSPLPTSPAATAPSIEIIAPATPGVPSITTQPRSPF